MDSMTIQQVRQLYGVERLSLWQIVQKMQISRKTISRIIQDPPLKKPTRKLLCQPYDRLIREFIRVLRLMEDYPLTRLRVAVEKALQINAHSRDAVLQFFVPRFSWRNTTFLLEGHPHLRLDKAVKSDLSAYLNLLSQGGGK